jgi:hypothetical protein
MNEYKFVLIVASLILLQGLIIPYTQENPSNEMILVPAYFYPTAGDFLKLLYSKPKKTVVVILNVNDGPGDMKNNDYEWAIEELINKGMLPVGYVYTNYGKRNIDLIKKDIDEWYKFYPRIRGVFLDEVSDNPNYIEYYVNIYNYIKQKYEGLVILNPGTNFPHDLIHYCDYAVVFEGNENNLKNFKLDPSLKPFINKLVILVYNVTNFEEAYNMIIQIGIHNMYLTDDTEQNPWDSLSKYYYLLVGDNSRIKWTYTISFSDPLSDNNNYPSWTDIVSLRYSYNELYIGFNLTILEPIPINTNDTTYLYYLLIDTDNNSETGYMFWLAKNIGAEYMVEIIVDKSLTAYLYKHIGPDWNWMLMRPLLVNVINETTIEVIIEKKDINLTLAEIYFTAFSQISNTVADYILCERVPTGITKPTEINSQKSDIESTTSVLPTTSTYSETTIPKISKTTTSSITAEQTKTASNQLTSPIPTIPSNEMQLYIEILVIFAIVIIVIYSVIIVRKK